MASRLGITTAHLNSALTVLRKRGFAFHPVGSRTGKNQHQKGVIVDTIKNQNYYIEVQNRYDVAIDARVNTSFRLVEAAWVEFPELRAKIESSINRLMMKLITEKEDIKQIE